MNEAGMQSSSGMQFSDALLAQALAFVRLLEQTEGGLISAPEVVLQIRFGYSPAHSLALAIQLEKLGCWSMYVDKDGQRKALVLYR